jgi:hypothetical protein
MTCILLLLQHERLCFRYVANPIALFDKTGACLYQNPESMTLHSDLRPFIGLHTPAQGAPSTSTPGADSVCGGMGKRDNAEHLQAEGDTPNQGQNLLLLAIFRGIMPLYEEMLRVTLQGRERHICEVKSVDNIVKNMLYSDFKK